MYQALYEAHRGLGMLSVALSVVWAVVALVPALRRRPRLWRPAYGLAMGVTGLSGLSGLAVMWSGSWLGLIFPWLGLAGFVVYSIAGARGRRALVAGDVSRLAGTVVIQLVVLAAVYALMYFRPF
jgi:hypothetical protein